MLKPQMPNIPGAAAVSDTLDFVKNLWGSMSVPGLNLPGMAAPTMSVDELDKKIADLKAVEAWLAVNTSMLRGTIQALEVQRGTIATLKSMGATLAQAVKQPGANEKSVLAAAPYASAFFAQPAEEKPAAAKAEEKPAEAKPKSADSSKPTAADASAAAAAVQMANPSAWWNMLQDQFKQAVSTAMSSEKMAGASALAQDAASKLVKAAVKPKAAGAPAKAPARKAAARKTARPRAAAKPKT